MGVSSYKYSRKTKQESRRRKVLAHTHKTLRGIHGREKYHSHLKQHGRASLST